MSYNSLLNAITANTIVSAVGASAPTKKTKQVAANLTGANTTTMQNVCHINN